MSLAEFWFGVIAVLWIGFLFLEGFDFGVGMLLPVLPRGDRAEREKEKRVLINTIGPVWDGNEVWLITAIGATFAAFPKWYASWLSALYLPLILVLLGLIARGVAFEYRGQIDHPRWRGLWTVAIVAGSVVPVLGIGFALSATLSGIPLDAAGNRVGSPLAVATVPAVVGAVGFAGFSLLHGSAFVALKTLGPIRDRARAIVRGWGQVALLPLLGFVGWLAISDGTTVAIISWGVGLVAAALSWWCARALRDDRRDGWSFALLGVVLVGMMVAAFASLFPYVVPSTVDGVAGLTVAAASASPYPLTVMTWLAAFGLPVVLAYQAWTYWVFRRRIGTAHIPDGTH